MLRSIEAFRKSTQVEANADSDHNIRAVRIMRRDILGLLRKAKEAKQKEDILKDPRGYLEALILEQEQQRSLTRLLAIEPPQEAAQAREARRAGLRAQRKLMENTGAFADELSQFHEKSDTAKPAPTSAPAGQPAETPREKLYKAAAKQIDTAIESQRDACAFLLDGDVKSANEKQASACDQMYGTLYSFPMEPGQVLVKLRTEQATLRQMVGEVKKQQDWLRDPLVPDAAVLADLAWDAEKSPIGMHQVRVGTVLALLDRQCEYVAKTPQPADKGKGQQADKKPPMLDPQLNQKLADVLEDAPSLTVTIMTAMKGQDQKATIAGQNDLLKLIDKALDLLPKTIEQRITELIVRQNRLNTEVQAEAGKPGSTPANAAATALEEIRNWATRFKSRLLGKDPAKLAEAMGATQKAIKADTVSVSGDVKKKIPAGTSPQATPPASTSQPSRPQCVYQGVEASGGGGRSDGRGAGRIRPDRGSGFPGADAARRAGADGPSEGAGRTGQGAGGTETADQPAEPGPEGQEAAATTAAGAGPGTGQTARAGPHGQGTGAGPAASCYQRRPRTVIKDW